MIGLLATLAFVTRFLACGMCGFCHAPEHAYDQLNEHPQISRRGLCDEAHERLLMAATPQPEREPGVKHVWDEHAHAWIAWRIHGACLWCDARTWKYAPEADALLLCRACTAVHIERQAALRLLLKGVRLPATECEARERELPRQTASGRDWIVFSDYEVRNTRDYERLPGPRAYARRPRLTCSAPLGAHARGSRRRRSVVEG